MLRTIGGILTALVSLLALGVTVAWLSGTFEEKVPPGEVESRVEVPEGQWVDVLRVKESRFEIAPGSVEARQRSHVASRILARIESVHVAAGDPVKEGDLLIVLDDRDLTARVRQAEESLTAAQASFEHARSEFERFEELKAKKVVSPSQFDAIDSQFRAARAQVARGERALEEARAALSWAQIRSPVAGRIVDRLAEPGDTALPGSPLLVVYDPRELRLEASVREALATELVVGSTMAVEIPVIHAEVTGTIQEIVPRADARTRTFLVKVALPPMERLYVGMFGRLLVPSGERERLCIPVGSVIRSGQLEFAWVRSADGPAHKRLIRTGRHSEGGKIEALAGVRVGESILDRKGAS